MERTAPLARLGCVHPADGAAENLFIEVVIACLSGVYS